jgi:transglutaminase-like putative cysteine protease
MKHLAHLKMNRYNRYKKQQEGDVVMRVRVGCELKYESEYPTPIIFVIRARDQDIHRLIVEQHAVTPETHIHTYIDSFGNHCWRLLAPSGELTLRYDALADVPSTPDPVYPELQGTLVQDLPDETLIYTLPSRHCQSDLIINEAWQMFGSVQDGWARVQAMCDWIHANIAYESGSTPSTSGYEVYQQRRGVCRDFAHIGVMFCRAMNIPARYVSGYLPDIAVPPNPIPMDFHAWFEAYIGGAWHTFDARHNVPRIGRVLIARGRDAVDTALATSYGTSKLVRMRVWADEVDDDVTLDHTPIALSRG